MIAQIVAQPDWIVTELLVQRSASVERINRPYNDVRQDALERVVSALHKRDEPIEDDAAVMIGRRPRLAMHCYDIAKKDWLREQARLGQKAKIESYDVWVDHLTGDEYDVSSPAIGMHPNTDVSAFFDEAAEECLEAVERDCVGDIIRFYEEGIDQYEGTTYGIDPEKSRKVVCTLLHIQRLKESGVKRTPDHLRKQVERLRADTGLRLDLTQL